MSAVTDTERPHVKLAPTMPQVTSGDRRLTNITLPNGEVVRGIRRQKDEKSIVESNKRDEETKLKPLRYTAGLKCDPHLESLRPERDSRHGAFERDSKLRKQIADCDQYQPKHFSGSFADADLQHFRPEPWTAPNKDSWATSRSPCPPLIPSEERLYMSPGNAGQIYPQDELSCIKMRNRRFLNACGNENVGSMGFNQQPMMNFGGMPMMYYPMMPMMQPVVMPPQPMPQPMMPQNMMPQTPMDELNNLDMMLNEKRRQHRPMTPHYDHEFKPTEANLEQEMRDLSKTHTPEPPARANVYPLPSSIEELPKPKPRNVKESKMSFEPRKLNDVKVADQIAIRSIVLGNSLKKSSGQASPMSSNNSKVASERSKSGSAEI